MGILINQGRQIGGLSEQDQANIGKVTQTETTTGAEYELLFSETAADATTHTEEARKSQYFKFNPHNKIFTVGTRKTTEPDNYTPIVTPGDYSTCLGYNVATEGDYCFSEGQNTFSAGTAAHAEGRYTHAGGNGAHAEGLYTIAWGDYQHVQGKYNVKDTNLIYAHIVGNGTSNARSNAYALRWDGQQDVTNDIVRVDSGGTWDGFNTSLEDALADKATKSIIANEYDNTATYEFGDYCIYENTLYLCDALQIVAEDFDPTKWIATSVAEENIGFNNFIKTKVSKSGSTMTGQLTGMNDGGSWKTARDHASFRKIGAENVSAYYPIFSVRGPSYDWSMGTLGDSAGSALYFVRTFDSDYSGTGNLTQNFVLYGGSAGAASSYTIAHSGNVGTGDSNGQVKIAGTNASVKGLAAAAYKGVFTRSSLGDIGWGTEANRTKVVEVSAIAYWNGRHSGTSSNLQYCDRGRFGTIVTKGTGDYLPIGGGTVTGYTTFKMGIDVNKGYSAGTTTNSGGLELFGGNDAFMDFHRLYSSSDFTYRITNRGDDTLDFIGRNSSTWGKLRAAQFAVQSSIHVKENIKDITYEEANKLLQLRPVSFDYSDKERSDRKNHRGLIAEEVLEVYPEMVDVPNNYTEFNPEEPWNVPSIDYSKFVPYLIKIVQIQQEQINTLTERLDNLNKN